MTSQKKDIKKNVKERYAQAALSSQGCCLTSSCGSLTTIEDLGKKLGYTPDQLSIGLGEANLGLGCGNPITMAGLQPGEVVLDLGSGAGFDAFLVAKEVGLEGRVIGVDMTPEMLAKARENARNNNYSNVEFRLGEIENLPVDDCSMDVVISNCVINLSPDKHSVYKEILRVLKPGGRVIISDILRSGEFPESIKNDPAAYTA